MYYVYKGDKAYQKMNMQKAISFYNKGLHLYPQHYGAWYNLGNIYVEYEATILHYMHIHKLLIQS